MDVLSLSSFDEVQNKILKVTSEDPSDATDKIGKSFYQLAKIYYDKADLAKSQELFEKAAQYAQLPRDLFSLFKTYGFLIRVASERLEDEMAKKYIKASEDLFSEWETKLPTLSAEYFFARGTLYNYQGHFKEAQDFLSTAYAKAKIENEPEVLAKSLYSLASLNHHQGNTDVALAYLGELRELLQIIDKSYLRGSMNLLFGQLYTEKERYQEALDHLSKASSFFLSKKSWNQHGYLLLAKGIVYKRMGQFDSSMTHYRTGLELTDSHSYKRLTRMITDEINDLNDSSVDIYLDRTNRKVHERTLGIINFKHRFVLLEILFLLAKNPGQYFDKLQLAEGIWKDNYNPLIHDKLIYTSVSRLRKLIEPKNVKGEKRKYLVRGKDGYCFNPDVRARFHLENRPASTKSIANIDISDPV